MTGARPSPRRTLWTAVPTLALFLLLVLLLTLGATAAFAGPAAAAELPPSEPRALAKRFRAQLAPLGLKVSRGLLQNLDTYEADPSGTHLALYVEPVDADYSSADYVKNFTKLTRRFVPKVFNRWKGLESFDICQEPVGDPREEPPPVTQIFLRRDALDRVGDWSRATLPELLASVPRDRASRSRYYVYFGPTVRDDPTLVAAVAVAGWPSPQGPLGS